MTTGVVPAAVDVEALRCQIQGKYTDVAQTPDAGFHFHTGRPLARMLGYADEIVDALPAGTVESFAGTGNPFSVGELEPGETVLDIGCGAGFDTIIAAGQVGPNGRVIAVDMTRAMLEKARAGAEAARLTNVDFGEGYAEALPAGDDEIDVVISNGVINLCPDKASVMSEVFRVLRPGGRASRSPTSSSTRKSPRTLRTISTSGPGESPVLCWKQSGSGCSNTPGSAMFAGEGRSTSSPDPGMNQTLPSLIPGGLPSRLYAASNPHARTP